MSEEEKSATPEGEVKKISIPSAPVVEETASSDIIASAAEKKERRSAVIGKVDRPSALEKNAARRGPRRPRQEPTSEAEETLFEKVVHINRNSKVVSGGRRFSFSALVVVGDQAGNVGVGYGKAQEVPDCIRKGTDRAKRNMESVELKNNTIPHDVIGKHDGGKVLLRPAVPGTGVIAGGGIRAVLEAAGIKDVLTKSLRSNNPAAMVFATLDAVRQLRSLETIKKIKEA